MKNSFFFVVLAISSSLNLFSQEEIALYKSGPKQSNGLTEKEARDEKDFVTYVSTPRMYVYHAPKEKATGASVVICPGGGYWGISVKKEGSDIAQWFNERGITAFVLYYRMPNKHSMIPLADAQQALKLVYRNAKKWKLDKSKIGIMGFSAGGHLAATAGTHFKKNCERPAFMILVYPVISFNEAFTHKGSMRNLVGDSISPQQRAFFSNELYVTKKTPPSFLVHGINDKTVPVRNSEVFKAALDKMGIPNELHILNTDIHGFGMIKYKNQTDTWALLLEAWLQKQKLSN